MTVNFVLYEGLDWSGSSGKLNIKKYFPNRTSLSQTNAAVVKKNLNTQDEMFESC